MTRTFLVLLIPFIVISGTLTPKSIFIDNAVLAADDPTKSPAGLEIARLRSETSGAQLERLNAALFFLVRVYDLDELFTMLKGASPEWIIARGEVEQHARELSRARLALRLYYKDDKVVRNVIRGMSEAEIIEHAQSLK